MELFLLFELLNVGNLLLKILRCVYCSCCSHVLFVLRCTIWMAVTVWNVRMSKIRSRSCQKVSHYVQIFLLQWLKYEDYNVKVHILRFVVPQSRDVHRSVCPRFCAHARQVTRRVHVIGWRQNLDFPSMRIWSFLAMLRKNNEYMKMSLFNVELDLCKGWFTPAIFATI